MKTKTRARSTLKLIAIVALCSVLAGCDDGPTGPRIETSIAGTWRGSLHPGLGRNFDPCLQPAAAAATIRQDGFRVSGSVTTESVNFRGGDLAGEFRLGQLSGTLTTGQDSIAVTGSSSANHLTVVFYSPAGFFQCGPNEIQLDR